MRAKDAFQLALVADVDALEVVTRICADLLQRVEIARVRQLVYVHDRLGPARDERAHDRGPNESGAAGDEHSQEILFVRAG